MTTISVAAAQVAKLVDRTDRALPALVSAGENGRKVEKVARTLVDIDAEVAPLEQAMAGALPEPVRDHLAAGRVGFAGGEHPSVDELAAYRAGLGGLRAAVEAIDAARPGTAIAAVQGLEGAEVAFTRNLVQDAATQARRALATVDAAAQGQQRKGGFLARTIGGGNADVDRRLEYANGLMRGAQLQVAPLDGVGALSDVAPSAGTAETGFWSSFDTWDRDHLVSSAQAAIGRGITALDAAAADDAKLAPLAARSAALHGAPVATAVDEITRASADLRGLDAIPDAREDPTAAMRAVADRLDGAAAVLDPVAVVAEARDGFPARARAVISARTDVQAAIAEVRRSTAARLLPARDLEAMAKLDAAAAPTPGGWADPIEYRTSRTADHLATATQMRELAATVRGYATDGAALDRSEARTTAFAAVDAFSAATASAASTLPAGAVHGPAATAARWRELATAADGWAGHIEALGDQSGSGLTESVRLVRRDQLAVPMTELATQVDIATMLAVPSDVHVLAGRDRELVDDVTTHLAAFADRLRKPADYTGRYDTPGLAGMSRAVADTARRTADGLDAAAAARTPAERAALEAASAAAVTGFDVPRLRASVSDARRELARAEDLGERAGAVDRAVPHYARAAAGAQGAIAAVSDLLPAPAAARMQAHATELGHQAAAAQQYLDDNPAGLLRRTAAKIGPNSAMLFSYLPDNLFPQRALAGQLTADLGTLDRMLDLLGDAHDARAAAPDAI